jgi:hypothetical protein
LEDVLGKQLLALAVTPFLSAFSVIFVGSESGLIVSFALDKLFVLAR